MFIVLNEFIEREHDFTLYTKGETYPKKGFKANDKRVDFLQKKHFKYGVAFLETPKEAPKPKATRKKTGDE